MFACKTSEAKAKVPKILLVIGLVVLLLASVSLPVSAVPSQTQPTLSPLNPEFVQNINDRNSGQVQIQRTAEGYSLGYVPSPHAPIPEAAGSIGTRPQTDWTLPSSYDLRTTGKLTGVRDQNPYGTCWAFAAYGSLESSLLPGETWDFSEDNLVLNGGFDTSPEGSYNHGGFYDMATAYLARWGGPVRQDEDAYGDSYTPPGLSPSKHIQEVLYLPNKSGPTDNDLIKNAVMTYGGVGACLWWANSAFNDANDAFYYSGSVRSNHAVVIVGWDDAFPASRFNSSPPGNGAFIVRNSWGTWFGQGGYFYVSYYDSVFGYNNYTTDVAVYNNAESTANYDTIYQYDPLGWVTGLGYSSTTAWFANAFTAGDGESLTAVSFYAPVANASYEIYSGSTLSSKQFRKSGAIEFPGYHTIPLDSVIALPSGQGFVVAVKLTTPGSNYPVALEYPYPGYSSQATAGAGQSFISSNGSSWSDITGSYANTNVCLKAFTTGGVAPELDPALSVSPNSLDFGSVDTQQTFTVQNSGGGTLSWNASESCDWITGVSPSSGSLGGGQGQSVNVTISRDGKAPGTYNSAIAVTSNGGSQGVSVAMTVPSPDAVQLTNLPQTVEIPAHLPFSLQIQADDSLGHTLTFALLSGPGSINPNSGLFSWNDPLPGQSNVLIQAACSGGASDQDTLTLQVTAIPPEASTGSADGLSQSAATLHGEVQPHQLTTSAWFQWGLTDQYGQETGHSDAGSGNSWVSVSAPLSGLLSGQLYHYRLVAQNASGMAYGEDRTFTTASLPPPLAIDSILATPDSGVSNWNPVTIQAGANRSGSWSGTIHHPSGAQIGTLAGGTGSAYSAVWAPPAAQNFCGSGFYAVVQVTADGETQTSMVSFAVENYPAKVLQVSWVNEASQPIANPKAGQAFYVVAVIGNNSAGALSCFSPLTVGNHYVGAGAGIIAPGQQLPFLVHCQGLAAGSYAGRVYVWVSLGGYALAQPVDFTLVVVP